MKHTNGRVVWVLAGAVALLAVPVVASARVSSPTSRPSSAPAGGEGKVTFDDDVVLTDQAVRWISRWRRAVPARIAIHITSGTRTDREQAAAMLRKVELGDDLVALYGERVRELLALPRDVDAWAAKIGEMRARGVYISRHLRADAIDVRTRTLSSEDVRVLITAAQQLGAHTVLESTPPHLHIDRFAAA